MMEFKRARTKEQIDTRREEILDACIRLYLEKGYESVNFKTISELISVSRPSIYNYYNTKGEMFLEILGRHYSDWADELSSEFDFRNQMEREEYCHAISDTLCDHEMILRLISLDLSNIENECSVERLVDFKIIVYRLMNVLDNSIIKFFKDTDEDDRHTFIQSFFVFILGLYPMSHPTEKQRNAMDKVGMILKFDLNKLCYDGLFLLSSNLR